MLRFLKWKIKTGIIDDVGVSVRKFLCRILLEAFHFEWRKCHFAATTIMYASQLTDRGLLEKMLERLNGLGKCIMQMIPIYNGIGFVFMLFIII